MEDNEKKLTSQTEGETIEDNDDNQYEHICYVCRRPESKAGKMITMPGGMCLCHDCMQKSFDAIMKNGMDFSQLQNMPYMNMNLNDFNNLNIPGMEIPKKQKIKKKSEKEAQPAFDLKNIPAPHKIKGELDQYVIGQEQAKKMISVAVYNHYKRVFSQTAKAQTEEKEQMAEDEEVRIEKSNILMIGPTGSGKTYLVKTLARLLDVPLAIADATALTEAGYIGDDIESVVSKLLAAADNDVEKAERGIIFIDEIDKIAKKKNTNTRDVSGESVQQELLKLLEGSQVEVPVGSNQKNALTPMASIGFQAELKDQYDQDPNILSHVTNQDLRTFGMIPEFLGRLPVVVTFQKLTREALVDILKKPKNAILKQYKKLLELDEVKLVFEDEALEWIAEEALKRDTGARALRAIMEEFMLDIMYEVPKDPGIGTVVITRNYLEKHGGPRIEMRG